MTLDVCRSFPFFALAMSAPERPPSLDPVAAARWSTYCVGEASPWLHEEVASRMQERLARSERGLALLDPQLVLHGGGNTSVKIREADFFGHEQNLIYIKGSGWDLATIEPPGHPAVRLQPLQALRLGSGHVAGKGEGEFLGPDQACAIGKALGHRLRHRGDPLREVQRQRQGARQQQQERHLRRHL